MRRTVVAAGLALLIAGGGDARAAADTWYEIKSPHFTVWSDANDGNTRTLVWQLEQVRSAVKALYPWVRVDLGKPMRVLAVRREQGMKQLVPRYWEMEGSVRPHSVWVTGADQHYIAIRSDVRGDNRAMVNPHTSVYFSYLHLVIGSSFARPLPMWFARGLAGVLSNTIVQDNQIFLGPPIPWHLELLRDRRRLPLRQLVGLERGSPEVPSNEELQRFDAQSWAFVHLLMFGDGGAHQARLNRFAALINAGHAPDVAFEEAIGRPEDYEASFNNYFNRSVFSSLKARVDAEVTRERFEARALTPAEASGGLALFHVAMGRVSDARAMIVEARKLNPKSPDAVLAEALMLDRAGSAADARAAYDQALALGSANPYAHYRAAIMRWGPNTPLEALQQMDANLARAVALNPLFAAAHASLADVRSALERPSVDVVPHFVRAIELEPSNVWHRLAAARSLIRLKMLGDARKALDAAVELAGDDASARAEAKRLLELLERNQPEPR